MSSVIKRTIVRRAPTGKENPHHEWSTPNADGQTFRRHVVKFLRIQKNLRGTILMGRLRTRVVEFAIEDEEIMDMLYEIMKQ